MTSANNLRCLCITFHCYCFILDEKKLFLIESIRSEPSLWDKTDAEALKDPVVEQKFHAIALRLGSTSTECHQMFQELTSKYHLKRGKVTNGKRPKVKWEFYDHLNFLQPKPSLDDVCYVNDAFNSAESSDSEGEDETRYPISSTVPQNRKRPYSPNSTTPKIFKKAADYMVAELENMERTKAERLLNKTMKFFVEHRYD